MRFPRVKAQGRSFYHCISRFVHGLYIFGTSGGRCAEAEEFLALMRFWAALTGIRIRKYVLMANHFHIMCEVPEPKVLTRSPANSTAINEAVSAEEPHWPERDQSSVICPRARTIALSRGTGPFVGLWEARR
jgi:hypothetical protein